MQNILNILHDALTEEYQLTKQPDLSGHVVDFDELHFALNHLLVAELKCHSEIFQLAPSDHKVSGVSEFICA